MAIIICNCIPGLQGTKDADSLVALQLCLWLMPESYALHNAVSVAMTALQALRAVQVPVPVLASAVAALGRKRNGQQVSRPPLHAAARLWHALQHIRTHHIRAYLCAVWCHVKDV